MRILIKKIIEKIFGNLKVKDYIIFESKPDFSDNAKRVFDYMIENKINNKYKLIWNCMDSNIVKKYILKYKYKNVRVFSDKNIILKIYYQARAKYIINCNRKIWKINKNTYSLNLWHGTLLKSLSDLKIFDERNMDKFLCPSDFYINIYENDLHIPKDKLLVLNNPRNDYLFSTKCDLNVYFNKNYDKFIIWMPTFRKTVNGNRIDSKYIFNKGIPVLQTDEDIEILNEILIKNNTLLVLKPHFAQDMNVLNLSQSSNIKIIYSEDLINNEIELYEFLSGFDALITDYSSVYFDFLVTNKPIGFTIDDIDEYSKGKGFVFKEPQDYMPGKKISSLQDMIVFIENLKKGKDEYKIERENICKLVNKYSDNQNAKRVCDYLKI